MFSEAGFGTPPQTGFPGEVAGRLRPPKTWKPIEQATMSYGHGLSVNLVQLARAYTIFADDGELKPVDAVQDRRRGRRPAGRVSAKTARAVRHMLELATLPGGTAPQAQVPGYRVAGKTGTARKIEGREYTRQVRGVVRRHRAGVESAADRRGDDRRADRRRLLRRQRRGPGVLERDGRRAADARRADGRAGRQRRAAAARRDVETCTARKT